MNEKNNISIIGWGAVIVIILIGILIASIYMSTRPESPTTNQVQESAISGNSNDPIEAIVKKALSDLEVSYAHVVPGEYSEIYAVVTGLEPGEEVEAYLTGEVLSSEFKKTNVADENGTARFVWRITSYGTYEVWAKPVNAATHQAKTVVVK